MKGLQVPPGNVLGEAEEKAVAHRVVALAHKHRYVWRRDHFRKWASEVAGKRA